MPLIQAISIRLTIGALCFTIIWSFLYAYGNFSGQVIVDIPNMLDFHGKINCFVFGTFTVIGWAINVPQSKQQAFTFPVSQIRGKLQALGDAHPGLVDQLSDFVRYEKFTRKHTAILRTDNGLPVICFCKMAAMV